MLTRRTLLPAAAAAGLIGRAHAAGLRAVTINYGVPQIPVSTAPIFAVPKEMGFWESQGLDVDIEGAQGAGPALQQLIAGRVQMTFTGLPAAMELINKGAPIKIVASVYGRNLFYPVVLADSPITDIAGLKGKTIGVTGIASTNALWIRAIMGSYGIASDDIHLVATGDGASAAAALVKHQVDALQLVEADYDRFETLGIKLKRLNAAPILQKLSFVQGLIVAQRTIDRDPDLVEKLLRGIVEASVYCQAHPEDAVRLQWKLYPESKPPYDAAKAMAGDVAVLNHQISSYTLATMGEFGAVTPGAVALARDTLAQLGQLSQKLPADRYFTDQFLKTANDVDKTKIAAMPPRL